MFMQGGGGGWGGGAVTCLKVSRGKEREVSGFHSPRRGHLLYIIMK